MGMPSLAAENPTCMGIFVHMISSMLQAMERLRGG